MKTFAILVSMSLLPPGAESNAPAPTIEEPRACSSCDARKAGLKKLYEDKRATAAEEAATSDDEDG